MDLERLVYFLRYSSMSQYYVNVMFKINTYKYKYSLVLCSVVVGIIVEKVRLN